MSHARRIHWIGQVESRAGVTALLSRPGDAVLVSRAGQHRWIVLGCPCGCGTELPINLDRRTGPAWRIYNSGPNLSLYPSVWRESGCEAHFIVSHGRIHTIKWDDWHDELTATEILEVRVLGTLRADRQHYADIADTLDEEPWDVLRACRKLVARGKGVEGSGDLRGHFSTVPV
jgi:hypothetical protein